MKGYAFGFLLHLAEDWAKDLLVILESCRDILVRDSHRPAFNFHQAAIRQSSLHRRTHRVIITNAARVLKEIREERKRKHGSHNYSMRAISKRLCRSNAWLPHIENKGAPLLRRR